MSQKSKDYIIISIVLAVMAAVPALAAKVPVNG